MGARACSRSGAAPARRASGEDAPAARDGRAPVWHHQGPDGRHSLPDEDAAKGRHRDGTARAGLQSDPRHEHHGHPAARGGDEGIVAADMRPSAVAAQPRTAGSSIRTLLDRKAAKFGKDISPNGEASIAPTKTFLHDQDPTETLAAKFAAMHDAVFPTTVCGRVRSSD